MSRVPEETTINTAKCIKEASADNRWCDEVMIEITGTKKNRKLWDKAIKDSFNLIMCTNQFFVNHLRATSLTRRERQRDKEWKARTEGKWQSKSLCIIIWQSKWSDRLWQADSLHWNVNQLRGPFSILSLSFVTFYPPACQYPSRHPSCTYTKQTLSSAAPTPLIRCWGIPA